MADQHMPEHFGQQPKASPAARTWAVILGLLLLAAGVVGVRETWLVGSGSDAQSWVQPVLNLIATKELQTWMIWAGIASIVVGLIFLFAAVKTRRTTHMQLASDTASMWMRPVDIARLSSATARRVPAWPRRRPPRIARRPRSPLMAIRTMRSCRAEWRRR